MALELESHGVDAATSVACWRDGECGEDVIARARLGLTVHEAAAPRA